MERIHPAAIAACLLVASVVGGCSAEAPAAANLDAGKAAVPGATHDPCGGLGFRGATVGGVACPGAPGCECASPQVCCLTSADSSKGTCESVGACRALALGCDGPEDCPQPDDGDAGALVTAADAGADGDAPPPPPPPPPILDAGPKPRRVCCLDEAIGTSGGSSTCRMSNTCVGKVLCRSDDDCATIPAFPHCRPADYGTPGVEDRGLDGLIGVCTR